MTSPQHTTQFCSSFDGYSYVQLQITKIQRDWFAELLFFEEQEVLKSRCNTHANTSTKYKRKSRTYERNIRCFRVIVDLEKQ